MKNTCLVYIAIAFLSLLVSNCSHPRSPVHGAWVVDSLLVDNQDYSLLLYSNMLFYEDDGTFLCTTSRLEGPGTDTGNYQFLSDKLTLTMISDCKLYNDTYYVKVLERSESGIISSMILQSKRKKIYLQKLP